ncbi:siderophore-interacting protein [Ornithinimicrobium pekingense]|uniref:Siderophore-interacting protein n=1 Tax=Ornithinimicrobium pekingense TaxID=384677 RepID=A0ABQ2FDR0_9MICO|nr:siderophore-interacting protein [Ornithinimicrobium pekingense]GGK78968.1 siderophore-interacting protein [Ornithinimicrobium pekingense]
MNAPLTDTLSRGARQVAERVASEVYARTMAMPLERTEHACVPATVLAAEWVAPQLRRLTVHAPGLAGWYAPLGPDEFVGLVMPRPGTSLPDLSGISGPNPRPVIGEMPEDVRPDVRWYTVRAYRPDLAEIDLEVVLHPEGEVDEGPGARWVRLARPGDELAVQTGTTCYHPPADARVQVVAGDETAYPSMVGIIEGARGYDVELHVLLETEPGAVPDLPSPERGSVTVVERAGRRAGDALVEALEAADLPTPDYGWVSGEQDLAARVRRHLTRERGVARTAVYFCAYWILGRPRG